MLGGSLRPRGGMPSLQPRLYTKDEELGKRDDDFRPKRKETMSAHFNPLRWRRRRLLGILAVLGLVYLFVHNIPTSLGPIDQRMNPAFRIFRPGAVFKNSGPDKAVPTLKGVDASSTAAQATATSLTEPTGAPDLTGSLESRLLSKHLYDGIIRYYRLAASLNKVSVTIRQPDLNHNVVFAASSLKSLANLLPIACAMASQANNSVHVALMSRSDLSMDEIKSINGLDADHCPLEFHDARPDYTEYSADSRHEAAVAGAMLHIDTHIAPHAIIVDDEQLEDPTFSRAMQSRAKQYFKTLIEIPANRYEEFMYIAHLDYSSLSHWHTPTIEIVVQAQNDSAGSLMRLLRTLSDANYKGIRLPKLTIDLATTIQQALKNVLSGFKWPPRYEPADKHVDTVTLRHHVQSQRLSTEGAALRFLESYYPANHDNHILILSSQVELSAQFMQYLHYNVLEYKYKAKKSLGTGELLGISLDVPTRDISGETDFVAPEVADKQEHDNADNKTPFLYGAPSGSSLLIFGDKWQVFHNFVTHRTDANHLGKAAKTEKVVSETEPAWLEYLLELMRARGWHVLFPAHNFATVHNELAQIPEEFLKETSSTRPAMPEATKLSAEEPFILAPETPTHEPHNEEKLPNPQLPLHETLPYGGILPKLDGLPYLSHDGDSISMKEARDMKAEYEADFRRRIGGCEEAEARRPRIIQEGTADDLFCLPTLDMVFDVQAEQKATAPP